MTTKTDLISALLSANCLKFGEFTLKSGAPSSYYIDLREATLHPELFKIIVGSIKELMSNVNYEKAAIVGVPYGVVPIASVVAYEVGQPYYPVRKEIKDYGRKTDADLLSDHHYILIEDVMSSGSSIIETIKKLDGKTVTDVIVIANRQAGGDENIKKEYPDVKVHSILYASDMLKAKTGPESADNV